MSIFLDERLKKLEGYMPGEQPSEGRYIKLNTNESPYEPSEEIKKSAFLSMKRLNLYPDPDANVLREKLAKINRCLPENIVCANGSDEILHFVFLAYGYMGIAIPDITYGFYRNLAQLQGIDIKEIPLNDSLDIVPDDYVNTDRMMVIPNPAAPTGKILSTDDLEKIVRLNEGYPVVIDEAYFGFGADTLADLIDEYQNLIIIRTFSKGFGFAGGRLGYLIAAKDIVDDINLVRYSINPYNIGSMTIAFGEAICDNLEFIKKNEKKIEVTREATKAKLEEMGFFCTKSRSNFIFAKHIEKDGEELYKELKRNGILVRHFKEERVSDYIRITVGKEDEMEVFLDTLKKII